MWALFFSLSNSFAWNSRLPDSFGATEPNKLHPAALCQSLLRVFSLLVVGGGDRNINSGANSSLVQKHAQCRRIGRMKLHEILNTERDWCQTWKHHLNTENSLSDVPNDPSAPALLSNWAKGASEWFKLLPDAGFTLRLVRTPGFFWNLCGTVREMCADNGATHGAGTCPASRSVLWTGLDRGWGCWGEVCSCLAGFFYLWRPAKQVRKVTIYFSWSHFYTSFNLRKNVRLLCYTNLKGKTCMRWRRAIVFLLLFASICHQNMSWTTG